MSLKRCKNGHFFDPKKHTFCPHCGVSSLNVGKTQPFGGDKTPTSPKAGATKMRGSASNGTSPAKRQKASASEEGVVTRRHGGIHEKGGKDEGIDLPGSERGVGYCPEGGGEGRR